MIEVVCDSSDEVDSGSTAVTPSGSKATSSRSFAQTTLSTWLSMDVSANPQLKHFLDGLEYLVSLRSLQTTARRHATDMQNLVSRIVAITPTSALPFLQGIVATARSAAYRNRRWAPHKPSMSAVIEGAKLPGLTHGMVLRSLIIARIFAVTSSRLDNWQQPLSQVAYYDRSLSIYRPFGHNGYY